MYVIGVLISGFINCVGTVSEAMVSISSWNLGVNKNGPLLYHVASSEKKRGVMVDLGREKFTASAPPAAWFDFPQEKL